MRPRSSQFFLFFLLVSCSLYINGCVTRTERIYQYESRDESVWEELQREFSWEKKEATYRTSQPAEPFYKRALHSLTTTVSGLFGEGDNRLNEREIAENRRHFNRKREAALQRLREQQELYEYGAE